MHWILQKLSAMINCLDKWDTYIQKLKNLVEDTLYKPKDRQNMKGSLKTWSRPNIPLLLAFFINALEIPTILSCSFHSEIIVNLLILLNNNLL